MTKSEGKCRVDSVIVGELSINMLGPAPTILAKYALSCSDTGERFGAGVRPAGWSDESLQRLTELIASLERDICSGVFEGHSGGSVIADPLGAEDGVPGF